MTDVMVDTADADTRLTSSEAILWTIERDPQLRSTIVVACLLDRAPDEECLRDRVTAAAATFPRLRQRVVADRWGLRWTEVGTTLDLDHHLRRYRLPAPGSFRQLLDDAGVLAGESFDPARPPWQVVVVEGLEGGGAALVLKIHHAITDGVGGVQLLPILTDPSEDQSELSPAAVGRARSSLGAQRVVESVVESMEAVGRAAAHPAETLAAVPRVARSVGRLLRPAGPPLSPVAAARGLGRHLETLEYPLAELAESAHAVDGTLNDAFVAAVIDGLYRYHEHHGYAPDRLRVTMPISTRRPGDAPGGNRFTPARFVVPLGITDPIERMRRVGDITRAWRNEPALALTDVLAAGLAQLPASITASVFGSLLKGVDFVATNVPGATQRTWIAGAEVLRMYAFAPPSGAALNVALLSHGSTCCIGINSDTEAIPDPDVLRDCLAAGFDGILRARSHADVERPATGTARIGAGRPARLTALDTAFLEMETPTTPMHVGALLVLDGAALVDDDGDVRIDAIRAEIASRLDRCPRMRQRLRPVPLGAARPVWVDDPTFDIARHVHAVVLPPPGKESQLAELCATLQMRVLDRSRPLWEMWFVGGLADGSVGLIYKVHHALVDGVSAAETFERLLGEDAATRVAGPGAAPEVSAPRLLWDAATDWFGAATDVARAASEAWTRPTAVLRSAAQIAAVLGQARPATHPVLNRPVGEHRGLGSITIDLDDLKATGRAHRATVNDVVLAVVAGGLRSLLTESGSAPTQPLQALVPVSLRGAGDRDALGNLVTGLVVPLPVHVTEASARQESLAAVTSQRKAGPEGPGMAALLRSADYWPTPALAAVAQLMGHQPFVNVVVTNVRGPRERLDLLGAPIREITPIVPLGRNLAIGVAAFSYAGAMTISVFVDTDRFDADHVASLFAAAYHDLHEGNGHR